MMEINGTSYELARTLRVAYEVQGRHNHKSYMEIFSNIDKMTIEEQIEILYVAFKIANPDVAKTFTALMFQEYCLDHFNLNEIMGQLNDVISGVLGKELTTVEDSEQPEGNV